MQLWIHSAEPPGEHRNENRKKTTTSLKCLAESAESESELFTGETSKDNHSPGPVFREVSP